MRPVVLTGERETSVGTVEDAELDSAWCRLFAKGVRVGTGRDQDERYNEFLRDLIAAGRIRLSEIVCHPLPLDAAPDPYRRFDRRQDRDLKIVLDPAAS